MQLCIGAEIEACEGPIMLCAKQESKQGLHSCRQDILLGGGAGSVREDVDITLALPLSAV